jgi:hypothetical protein
MSQILKPYGMKHAQKYSAISESKTRDTGPVLAASEICTKSFFNKERIRRLCS